MNIVSTNTLQDVIYQYSSMSATEHHQSELWQKKNFFFDKIGFSY